MLAPSTQPELLDSLRQRLLVWEAGACAAASSFSSGSAALDRIVPENGFRRGTLVDYVAEARSGATVLALIAAREACRDARTLVVVDRGGRFNPPVAACVGIDLANTIFVRPRTRKDELWSLNQSLQCLGVGAVLSWMDKLDGRAFRALQLAAEKSGAVGLFVRPIGSRGQPTWASLQLLVEALPAIESGRRVRIEILRCKNGQAGNSVEVELDDETGSLQPSHVMPSTPSVAAATAASGTTGA